MNHMRVFHMLPLLIIIFSVCVCGDVYRHVTFSGHVYDSKSGFPIEGVVVYIGNCEIPKDEENIGTTDINGYFQARQFVDCGCSISIYLFHPSYTLYHSYYVNVTCDDPKHDFYLEPEP